MKNQFFLMIILCLISNIAYSMSIDLGEASKPNLINSLDEASRAKLIEKVKKENVERNYWPNDVIIRVEQFYKMPANSDSVTKYFIRVVGSFSGDVLVEHDSGNTVLYRTRLCRPTQGLFSKEELESLGVQLPE